MGFTVAESFMLIAFALLLLLTIWRYAEVERGQAFEMLTPGQISRVDEAAKAGVLDDLLKLQDAPAAKLEALAEGGAIVPRRNLSALQDASRLVKDEGVRQLAEEAAKLSPDLRQSLVNLLRRDSARTLHGRMKLSPVEIEALAEGGVIVAKDRLRALNDASRLVAEEEIRQLAEAAAKMPPDLRRRLVDLVRLEDYRDLLERLNALKQLEKSPDLKAAVSTLSPKDREKLARLRRSAPLGDWAEALSPAIKAGMTPADVARAIDDVKKLKAATDTAGGIERRVAERIRAQTGQLVARMGGEITETGDVILPDALLFAAGKATPTPDMREFLDGFCRPWFEILHEAGNNLSTVQIEGHASSEWRELGPQAAFLENLRLSQHRARAVFEYCLKAVGGGELGRWARDKLAAVGYSSARPIMVEGKEDRVRSRRVVFSIDADRNSLFERIDAAKAASGVLPQTPRTNSLVTDR